MWGDREGIRVGEGCREKLRGTGGEVSLMVPSAAVPKPGEEAQQRGSRKFHRTLDEFCSMCAFVRAPYALPHPSAALPLQAK